MSVQKSELARNLQVLSLPLSLYLSRFCAPDSLELAVKQDSLVTEAVWQHQSETD